MVTTNSTQYTESYNTVPAKVPETHEWMGRLRIAFFQYTQAATGTAADDVRLVKLPAGKVRLILPLSRLAHSAWTTSTTLDLGWEAYTDDDGSAVAADPNGLDDGVDITSVGSFSPGGTVLTHETKLFESQAGVVITGQFNDAAPTAADTLDGYFIYVVD